MDSRRLVVIMGAVLVSACGGSAGSSSASSSGGGTGSSTGTSSAGSGSTSGGSTGTNATGSGSTGSSGAAPISAPDDTWTWVDFADSKCASGTPTGMGINPHAGSTDLLIYMEGGGACSTGATCWGPQPTANNVGGYGAAQFASTPQRGYPIFSRDPSVGSPFAAANQVFVPYCTGDMHSGTAEVDLTYDGGTIPTYFWGAKDIDLFMARVAATFPGMQHVWLAGTSAGGFGSFLAYQNVTRAFPGVRVDIIDDSGPAISPSGTSQNAALARYGFVPPAGCASPCNSNAKVLAADRAAQPDSKYAFLTYASDPVISADMNYTVDQYPQVIDQYVATFDANSKAFIVTNRQQHVVESEPQLAPVYLPWLTLMVNDDPSWDNKTYVHP